MALNIVVRNGSLEGKNASGKTPLQNPESRTDKSAKNSSSSFRDAATSSSEVFRGCPFILIGRNHFSYTRLLLNTFVVIRIIFRHNINLYHEDIFSYSTSYLTTNLSTVTCCYNAVIRVGIHRQPLPPRSPVTGDSSDVIHRIVDTKTASFSCTAKPHTFCPHPLSLHNLPLFSRDEFFHYLQ